MGRVIIHGAGNGGGGGVGPQGPTGPTGPTGPQGPIGNNPFFPLTTDIVVTNNTPYVPSLLYHVYDLSAIQADISITNIAGTPDNGELVYFILYYDGAHNYNLTWGNGYLNPPSQFTQGNNAGYSIFTFIFFTSINKWVLVSNANAG